MNVLFTRAGTKSNGSWEIRGVQISEGLRKRGYGAQAVLNARPKDIDKADLIVLVKRIPTDLIPYIKLAGKPIVLDIVDAWPQPNTMFREEAIEWMIDFIELAEPNFIIWPTFGMLFDCAHEMLIDGMVVYHHSRAGLKPISVKPRIDKVVYEGSPRYINNEYGLEIEKQCAKRGWQFLVNPDSIERGDMGVAFRGGDHENYTNTHWKSNVKLTNFQAAGLPCILQPECGYLETAQGGEQFIESIEDISKAFDKLSDFNERKAINESFKDIYNLDYILDQYESVIKYVLR